MQSLALVFSVALRLFLLERFPRGYMKKILHFCSIAANAIVRVSTSVFIEVMFYVNVD